MLKGASKPARKPKASKASKPALLPAIAALLLLAVLSAAAVVWVARHGYTLYYGDAEAHLNIARRIVDSRTPGYGQIGTVWLPLPHVLMLPLVRNDALWHSGLAGAIPSAACFVLAGTCLFALSRRALGPWAAAAATAVFALNPNLLYLQATPMTETIFLAASLALLYCSVVFQRTQSVIAVAGAGIASAAASLTRYEGWFLIPFVALYFFFAGKRRPAPAILFAVIAALGPLYWLAHNWYYFKNPLEFYNGPWSARAIYQRSLQAGMAPYRGDHNWADAWLYFRSAARLCAGLPAVWLGLAGLAAAVIRRAIWPLVFLSLAPMFYVWSIHSSGTPIFVPHLWPNSYYNTRYGLAALPLLALGAAALVTLVPARFRVVAAMLVAGVSAAPWLGYPSKEAWICWKESQVNSETRRAWTRDAADFLRSRYDGGGIAAPFGDITGIFREAGIPLKETLHEGNSPTWDAALSRPELFFREEWAVDMTDGRVAAAILKLERHRKAYECVRMVHVQGGPVLEIFQRRRLPPSEQP